MGQAASTTCSTKTHISGLTEGPKQGILDAHNKLRKKITLGERRRSLYQVKKLKSLVVQEQVGPFLIYKSLTISNYAKGGNTTNRSMYLAGPACTECPQIFTCEDDLCTKKYLFIKGHIYSSIFNKMQS